MHKIGFSLLWNIVSFSKVGLFSLNVPFLNSRSSLFPNSRFRVWLSKTKTCEIYSWRVRLVHMWTNNFINHTKYYDKFLTCLTVVQLINLTLLVSSSRYSQISERLPFLLSLPFCMTSMKIKLISAHRTIVCSLSGEIGPSFVKTNLSDSLCPPVMNV